MTSRSVQLLKALWRYRSTIVLFTIPVVFLPLTVGPAATDSKKALYCLIVMGVYWLTEAIPMPVTSLLPAAIFPVMGVMAADKVAINYLKDTNVLFIGGLIMAIAVEASNLHKRVALKVLLLMGSQKQWLLLGFMLVTWFLSMCISNTATTAMLLPIAITVLDELARHAAADQNTGIPMEDSVRVEDTPQTQPATAANGTLLGLPKRSYASSGSTEGLVNMAYDPAQEKIRREDSKEQLDNGSIDEVVVSEGSGRREADVRFEKCLLLSIAYAANIGGTATLTGTTPNLIMAGQMKEYYNETFSYVQWIATALPGAFVGVMAAWVWMLLRYFGPRGLCGCCYKQSPEETAKNRRVKQVIRAQYEQLGGVTFREIIVLINFLLLVLMWIFREPIFIPGWSSFFTDIEGYISDGTASMIVAMSLFVCPSQIPMFLKKSNREDPDVKVRPVEPVLDWDTVNRKLPWGVVFLMGAGYALAEASSESGLSKEIADGLRGLDGWPPIAVLTLTCVIITVLTNFTSNTATITILIPILVDLSAALCINPLYLLMPATINASYAFMLPVATPPNALVFASGKLKVLDMVIAGSGLQVVGILVALFVANTYGMSYLSLDQYPMFAELAMAKNGTGCLNITSTPPAATPGGPLAHFM